MSDQFISFWVNKDLSEHILPGNGKLLLVNSKTREIIMVLGSTVDEARNTLTEIGKGFDFPDFMEK